MLEGGYVRVYRSFLNWEWYDDANTMRVFLHLILTANWEQKKWRGIIVERGQRVASYASLSSELKMSVKSVRTSLNHLKQTGEVAILASHEYSIITIKNYEMYQDTANQTASEGQTTGKAGASEGQQLKKDKESNKAKKAKEEGQGSMSGAEKSPPDRKVFISLILNDGTEYPVYEDQVPGWKTLYPAVDVEQDLRNMAGWCKTHPTQRKTKRGTPSFINSWLARTQNRGGNNGFRGSSDAGGDHGKGPGGAAGESPKYGKVY